MAKLTRILIVALAIVSLMPIAMAGEDTRPNVLFIAVDDLKPLTGWYGSGTVITPAFDRLAERGTVFTRAYTQYPVCGPSRASLLTGQRPEVNGVLDLKTRMRDIHPDILTLPQFFKDHGYQTAAVGKIFDPRNVDSRDDDDPVSWSIPYVQSLPDADRKLDVNYAVRSIDAPSGRFIDGAINNRGIELMQQMAADDRPFFLAVGYKKPHLPFAVPKKFFDLYDRNAFGLEVWQQAPEGADASFILMGNNEMRSYVPAPGPDGVVTEYPEGRFTDDQQRELLHGYYAAVSFIDSLLAELLAELEKTGQADNTVIVLWGDHGWHLGDHGMWGKHTTMEQANRVPLIIHAPGRNAGNASTTVELMDLFPTLVELADLDMPPGLMGKSLVPVLDDPSADLSKPAISQYKRKGAYGYSMRTERYRYTEWVMPDGRVAYRDLYDLAEDPGETLNIGNKPENAALMNELAALLRRHGAGLKRLEAGGS
jgi:arylsulfatase A-like enzyme